MQPKLFYGNQIFQFINQSLVFYTGFNSINKTLAQ